MNKKLMAYFAENRVAANLLMVFLVFGGIAVSRDLPVHLLPNVDLRAVSVTVVAPGSTPIEVEQDINRRLEESLVGLGGVERVISTAEDGFGTIKIELKSFADPQSVIADVKDAVDGIENFPPVSAEQPVVRLLEVEFEVLTLSVASESASEDELRKVAEYIRGGLLAQPAISHVELDGARDREITIELDEEQLRRYGLTFSQISRLIQRQSINLSFGELHAADGSVALYTESKKNTGEEYKNIPLISRLDGSILSLGDIATVRDGFSEQQVLSELDGVPAVFIQINYDKNQSITDIAEKVKSWVAAQTFPDHIDIEVWNDPAAHSVKQIKRIISNGLIGLILVFICLLAVFDLRVATWVTLGIPISFIGSFLLLGFTDISLNTATIFGFFLMIGIVVDDAVVVGEDIAVERHGGKSGLDASIAGGRRMASPISVGAITTVLAFVPLLFITAERFQLLTVLPYIALFVLLVSLVEAFLILPAHLSHDKPWSLSPLQKIQGRVSGWLDDLRDQIVAPIVMWSVQHAVLVPVIGVLVVIGAFLLLLSGTVRVIMFDESSNVSDSIRAEIYMPVGTPFSATRATAERFAQAALAADDHLPGESIKTIRVDVGSPVSKLVSNHGATLSNRNHIGSVELHLNEPPDRMESVPEFEQAWREYIGNVSHLEYHQFQTTRYQAVPSISYSLSYNDRDVLLPAAKELREMISKVPGVFGLSDNMAFGKKQLQVDITPRGKLANLTPAEVGKQLRASLHGLEVQRIQRGHDEIKVMLRYPEDRRKNLSELATERIHQRRGAAAAGTAEIPLAYVAEITEARDFSSLSRIDGTQAAFVDARVDEAVTTPIRVRRAITNDILPKLQQKYPSLNIQKEGAARQEAELLKVLSITVPLVLIAMYGLVAAFLRSYWKPLVVVLGIPVAFAGAVFNHWILGWDFTTMSVFGVVGVLGVIVNDGLVLLDRYNYLRRTQPDLPVVAVASAAMRHRFRAVLITSLTTILGLSPLLYERSEEIIIFVRFVVSMLGGLTFAGIFTIFILPSLVMLVEGRKE